MKETFAALGVETNLAEALGAMGIESPTEVQRQAIPAILAGRSVIAQSATGTGKTLAYLLPLVMQIDAANPAAQAVVLAPTYELAMQIYRVAERLAAALEAPVRCASLIGGANIARQIENLKKKPQLLVGSAQRINELVQKKKLALGGVFAAVLDEADKLLDKQQEEATRRLVRALRPDCRYLLFSATVGERTLRLADFAREPQRIVIAETGKMPPQIENLYVLTAFRDKIEVLRKLARNLNVRRMLVFVNRSYDARALTERLQFHKLPAALLSAEGDKLARKKALDDFAKGTAGLLIASDLAARGLDVADVDCVVQYDLPEDERAYLHRAGRTGRAGKAGCVVTLAAPQEKEKLLAIARKLRIALQEKRLQNGALSDAKSVRAPRPKHSGARTR